MAENQTSHTNPQKTYTRTLKDDIEKAQAALGSSQSPTREQLPQKRNVKPSIERRTGLKDDTQPISAEDVFDVARAEHEHADGVIVKDTRRDRWTLTRALTNAFKSWFGEQKKKTLSSFKNPTRLAPDVAPAATRTEIIKKAGAQSHLAPRDDHKLIIEQLRTYEKDVQRATNQPGATKKEKEDASSSWTHFTKKESGDTAQKTTPPATSIKQARPTLRSAEEEKKNLVKEAETAPKTGTRITEMLKRKLAVTPKASARPTQSPKAVSYGYADIAPTVLQKTSPKKMPEQTPVQPAPPPPVKKQAPHIQKRAGATVRTYRDDVIKDVEKNKRSVAEIAAAEAQKRTRAPQPRSAQEKRGFRFSFVLVPIAVVIIVASGVFGYMQFSNRDMPVSAVRVPSQISGVSQIPIDFSTSRETLMTLLTDAFTSAPGPKQSFVQLYPSRKTDLGEQEPISTATFMDVFDPRANGSFVRSLENNMMFGAYLGEVRAPFFIFETNQFDLALAGMIGWEENMSADLAPLFGEPVRRTFDPTARTLDAARNATYVDDTIRNTDVRILYDELGEERIVYAFIDKKTIVITTTPEAIVALIEVLR